MVASSQHNREQFAIEQKEAEASAQNVALALVSPQADLEQANSPNSLIADFRTQTPAAPALVDIAMFPSADQPPPGDVNRPTAAATMHPPLPAPEPAVSMPPTPI